MLTLGWHLIFFSGTLELAQSLSQSLNRFQPAILSATWPIWPVIYIHYVSIFSVIQITHSYSSRPFLCALVAGHQSYHSDIVSTDSIAIKTSPITILRVNIRCQLSFCFNSLISLETMKHGVQNSVDQENITLKFAIVACAIPMLSVSEVVEMQRKLGNPCERP